MIIDESNRITDIVHQQKGYIGGLFKVGIIPTITPTLLPLFLKEVITKYTEVQLIIEELTTENIILKLKEGHCFKNSIINLCKSYKTNFIEHFQLETGNFNTLLKLAKSGLGMTLRPYLNTLDLNEKDKKYLREFTTPLPTREVSLIYHKSQLKKQLIEVLKTTVSTIISQVISFHNIKIISPLEKTSKKSKYLVR